MYLFNLLNGTKMNLRSLYLCMYPTPANPITRDENTSITIYSIILSFTFTKSKTPKIRINLDKNTINAHMESKKDVSDSDVEKINHDFLGQLEKIKIDHVGLDAHQSRKSNGFRLFGKYYQALWD